MKKFIAILLITVLVVSFTACGNKPKTKLPDKKVIEEIFNTVTPIEAARNAAKQGSVVLFEKMECVAGQDIWDSFVEKTSEGEPCEVLVARYYDFTEQNATLEDKEGVVDISMFYYLVDFDGKEYHVKVRMTEEDSLDSEKTFKYMMHFAGEGKLPNAAPSTYDRYVLTEKNDVTWEDLEWSTLTSTYDPDKDVGAWMTIYENVNFENSTKE